MEFIKAQELAKKLDIDFYQLKYGYQYLFSGNIITVYPFGKKPKWNHNRANAIWHKYTEGADEKIIDRIFNPIMVIPEGFEIMNGKQAQGKVIMITDQGTQACIDHVNRKIELMKGCGNNQLLTTLKMLSKEFTQYL